MQVLSIVKESIVTLKRCQMSEPALLPTTLGEEVLALWTMERAMLYQVWRELSETVLNAEYVFPKTLLVLADSQIATGYDFLLNLLQHLHQYLSISGTHPTRKACTGDHCSSE